MLQLPDTVVLLVASQVGKAERLVVQHAEKSRRTTAKLMYGHPVSLTEAM